MNEKIVFLSHQADRTGAPIVLLHLLRWLKQNTKLEFIILLEQGGELEEEFSKIAETYIWNLPNSMGRWKNRLQRITNRVAVHQQKIIKVIKKFSPNVIYANTIASALLGIELKRFVHCPIVCHVHELSVVINEYFGEGRFTSISRNIDFFIAASHAVEINLHKSHDIPFIKTQVVHEFVPELNSGDFDEARRRIRQQLNIDSEAFVVAGAGSVDWRKGPDLFIQVAQQVGLVHDATTEFIWIGGKLQSHDGQKVQHDVANAGVKEYVHFVGSQSNPYEYLNVADLFLLTSREDPYPLVCLEAASLGKPIICFADSGGMPEFVEQDCGIIIPYLRIDLMTAAVLKLRNSEELRQELGRNAARKLRERHTIDLAAQQISELLQKFIVSQHLVRVIS